MTQGSRKFGKNNALKRIRRVLTLALSNQKIFSVLWSPSLVYRSQTLHHQRMMSTWPVMKRLQSKYHVEWSKHFENSQPEFQKSPIFNIVQNKRKIYSLHKQFVMNIFASVFHNTCTGKLLFGNSKHIFTYCKHLRCTLRHLFFREEMQAKMHWINQELNRATSHSAPLSNRISSFFRNLPLETYL